jgi:hypothetical protein
LNPARILRPVAPNPPYFATVVVAIVLMVVGLSLEGSLFSVAALNTLVGDLTAAIGVAASAKFIGQVLIVAAPALLIVGSLVRGI